MSFFLSPIKFIFELIGFLISAAFVYGLALIASVTFLIYGITDIKSRPNTIVEYVNVIEETVEKAPELICIRLSGCKINDNAKTEEEYCPTCIRNSHKRNKDTTSKIDGDDLPSPESKTW